MKEYKLMMTHFSKLAFCSHTLSYDANEKTVREGGWASPIKGKRDYAE